MKYLGNCFVNNVKICYYYVNYLIFWVNFNNRMKKNDNYIFNEY